MSAYLLTPINTGRLVGQMTAYIGAYNLLCCRRYKKLVLFWRNRTRLANAPTPEQIISTYIRCHLPYQSACVNTGSGVRGEVGLYINSKKTQCINYNQPKGIITAINGGVIKEVEDYKYLGAWISSSKKDFTTRRAQAWDIAHKLKPLLTSKMPRATKVGVLTAAVESVLLYGNESWTLAAALTKRLHALYTRLLRFALNITWRDKWTNEKLYRACPRYQRS